MQTLHKPITAAGGKLDHLSVDDGEDPVLPLTVAGEELDHLSADDGLDDDVSEVSKAY